MLFFLLIFISYPTAWIIYERMNPEKVKLPSYSKLLIIMIGLSGILVFSPFSFVYNTLNVAILFLTIILFLVFGLLLKSKKHWAGTIISMIGIFTMIGPVILFIAFILNPLYISFLLDMEGITAKSVTKVDGYRLEHYAKSSNFTYAGNHIIIIKKEIIPYLIEMEKGKVDIGVYNSYDLPENKITIHRPQEQMIEISSTLYEVTDTTLIKKKYTFGDGSYSDVESFKY